MSSRSSNNYPVFPNFHRVGFVKSAHGIRGEVFIKLFADSADWIEDVERVSLLKPASESLSAVGLDRVKAHKDGLVALLDGVRDRDVAEALKGAQVYISTDLLVSAPGEAIYLAEILKFELRSAGDELLGVIVDFATNGAQDLLVVERTSDGRRGLVPFVEAFVLNIDFDKRVVRVDLPPGLLEL